MAKKKTKTKVARPFATTSIPSTTKKIETPVDEPEPQNEATTPKDISSLPPKLIATKELDSVQTLLDDICPKVEKEALRLSKILETELRFARSDVFQGFQINPRTTNTLLSLASSEESEWSPSNLGDNKVLASMAITYGTLRRFGFGSSTIDMCLQEMKGVSLDEAFEWLTLHLPEAELDLLNSGSVPRYSIPNKGTSRRENDSNSFTPPMQSDSDPNVAAVEIQQKIDTLTVNKNSGNSMSSTTLKGNQLTQSTPLDQAQASETSTSRMNTEPVSSESNPQDGDLLSTDIFDDFRESEGSMFDILDTPTSVVTDQGRTLKIMEFTLSKTLASSPKYALETYLAKTGNGASVSYQCQAFGFRAYHADCTIHRSGTKKQYNMPNDVACPEEAQAVQYAALVALHDVVNLGNEVLFLNTNKASPGFLSQLPPSFRRLWDELEVDRQSRANSINRSTIENLQQLLQCRITKEKGMTKKSMKNERNQGSAPVKSATATSASTLQAFIQDRQVRPAYQTMLKQRMRLPIAGKRNEIIQLLESEQILIVCGETGSGKSTQLPTYILEHELSQGRECKIICTEPRRLSAVSLAKRCSIELGEDPFAIGTLESLIGYSIRLENKVSANTRLNFVTHGIAVRMFSKYSAMEDITHLIIDEVHERSVDVDFLLLILKSLLSQHPTFKIVLMSATAESEKLSRYFGFAKTLYISGRTFPVDVRFMEDAIEETNWSLTTALKKESSRNTIQDVEELPDTEQQTKTEAIVAPSYSPRTLSTMKLLDDRTIPYDLVVVLLQLLCLGLREILTLSDLLEENPKFDDNIVKVFLLHSTLSSDAQNMVFDTLPAGMVKIVIATNIAETGITISDITCVVDTCKHREMRYQRQTNRLLEMFISKANALQRRGRAGRVRPGECYHLCSRERFEKMLDYPIPEMLRVNLTDIALNIKSLNLDMAQKSIAEVLSDAPEPPPPASVQRAVSMLMEVGAISTQEELTPMGRQLGLLPADLHLSKLMIMGVMLRCLDPALTVAAILSSKSPFVNPIGRERQAEAARARFNQGNSDFLSLHCVFSSWRTACANGTSRAFCRENFVNEQVLAQIEELRQQFVGYLIDSSFIRVSPNSYRDLKKVQASRGRRRLHKTQFFELPEELCTYSNNELIVSAALTAGLYPRIMKIEGKGMKNATSNQAILFHPTSVNFPPRWGDLAQIGNYWTFFTLTQSQNKKVYANESGPSNILGLILLCGEPEFKLGSSSIYLGKLRFRAPPNVVVGLKIMRNRLDGILVQMLRKAELTEGQVRWLDLACRTIGNVGEP